MKKNSAKAPGKLILMGEHSVVYGHPCIVTAVDRYIAAIISEDDKYIVDAPDVSNTDYVDKMTSFFCKKNNIEKKFKVTTKADFSDMNGLGSSSAVSVATCKALNDYFETGMSKREIFDMSYHVVKSVQGSGSGADVAAGTYGGTIYYEKLGKNIEPVDINGMSIVIGNTGVKAKTKEYVAKVAKAREENTEKIDDIFQRISALVLEAKRNIADLNYKSLGEKMTLNHKLLCELNICTPELDRLVEVALKAGAFGAKLSGAGGGDNMFALVSSENRSAVEDAITNAGGTVINAQINVS